MYQSPHHTINASYNYWHDLNVNVTQRTRWDEQA